MRIFFLTVLLSSLTSTLHSQIWLPTPLNDLRNERQIVPKAAKGFITDATALKNLLFSAPHEQDVTAENSETLLTIPLPDGNEATFSIVAYNLSQPADLARYPNLRTWYGSNPDVPGQTIFLDWTARGFHASVSGGNQP
ncbi:MAG: hypothetical protein AAF597_19820, partial [Bacteroidota bacterium]